MPEYAPDMTQPYHMSKPTEAGIARFTALLEELSGERDVVKASMFGMPGIKRRGGKAFCGLYGEDMIFKLAGEDHARALSLRGGTPLRADGGPADEGVGTGAARTSVAVRRSGTRG